MRRPLHEAAFTTRRTRSALPSPQPRTPPPRSSLPPPRPSSHTCLSGPRSILAGGLSEGSCPVPLGPVALSSGSTPHRLEAAVQTVPGEALVQPPGLPPWGRPCQRQQCFAPLENGSIGALKLTSSSESTVEFKTENASGVSTGLHTGSWAPPTHACSSQPSATLTADREAYAPCLAVCGGGSGRKRHQISSSQLTDALLPPPPRGMCFIPSFSLHCTGDK